MTCHKNHGHTGGTPSRLRAARAKRDLSDSHPFDRFHGLIRLLRCARPGLAPAQEGDGAGPEGPESAAADGLHHVVCRLFTGCVGLYSSSNKQPAMYMI